jgi:hypothetical protein
MNTEQVRKQLQNKSKRELVDNIMILAKLLSEAVEESTERAESVIEKYGYVSTPGQCADDTKNTYTRCYKMLKLSMEIEIEEGKKIT